ncbi:MAG: Hpt domain-containing protein [Sphingomonadales bacterium]
MATEFESRLDALRARFADRCAGHAADLDSHLAGLASAPGESRTALRAIAHQLVGTAGTFGFTRIATLAGTLERLCSDGAGQEAVESAGAALRAALQAPATDTD